MSDGSEFKFVEVRLLLLDLSSICLGPFGMGNSFWSFRILLRERSF